MARNVRLDGRNGEIWRRYCRGTTMEQLAEDNDLSVQRVSQIVREVADGIPQQERAEIIAQELDHMREVRTGLLELWDGAPVPVTQRVGDVWEYVRDPDTGAMTYDHTGRLSSAGLALKYSQRMHTLLGLDAAQRVDLGVSEEAAARLAAQDAVAHLHGGTEEP